MLSTTVMLPVCRLAGLKEVVTSTLHRLLPMLTFLVRVNLCARL